MQLAADTALDKGDEISKHEVTTDKKSDKQSDEVKIQCKNKLTKIYELLAAFGQVFT